MLLLLRYKTGLSGSRKRGNSSNHQIPSRKRSRKDSHIVAPTKENIFEEDSPSLSDSRTNQRLGKDCVVTESVSFSTLDRTSSPVVGLSGSREKSSVPEVLRGTATGSTTKRGTRGRGRSRRAQKNNSNCDIAVQPVNPLGTGRGKLTGCSLGFSSAESEGTTVSARLCTAVSGRKTSHSDSAVQPRGINKIDNGAAATSTRGGRGGRGGRGSSISRYHSLIFVCGGGSQNFTACNICLGSCRADSWKDG